MRHVTCRPRSRACGRGLRKSDGCDAGWHWVGEQFDGFDGARVRGNLTTRRPKLLGRVDSLPSDRLAYEYIAARFLEGTDICFVSIELSEVLFFEGKFNLWREECLMTYLRTYSYFRTLFADYTLEKLFKLVAPNENSIVLRCLSKNIRI